MKGDPLDVKRLPAGRQVSIMKEKTVLKLQLPTDPQWVKNVVESNIEEILTDHAFCEQKAASNAITLIVQNPNLSDLVQEMAMLVQEEMEHLTVLASESKIIYLELNVNRANPALGFYTKLGFEISETVDIPYYQFILNDYVMRKAIR